MPSNENNYSEYWTPEGGAGQYAPNYSPPSPTQTPAVSNDPYDPYSAGTTESSGQWAEDHRIDPQTGQLIGPSGMVPWQYARSIQAEHDRAIWGERRRLMQRGVGQFADATSYQRGALGLLQSFRAGGGAALESGVYGQVAGSIRQEGAASFQQAQLTQPMDFMSDLRRHENSQAQSRANRAQERQTAIVIGQALAQAAVAYYAPAASPYVGAAIGIASNFAQQANQPGAAAAPAYSANVQGSSPAGGPMPPLQGMQTTQGPREQISQQGQPQEVNRQPGPHAPFQGTGGGEGEGGGGAPGSAIGPAAPGGGTAAATLGDPQGGGMGAGGPGAGPAGPGAGGLGGGLPGGTAAAVGVAAGADGDFSNNGFGRAAAMQSMGNPASDMMATSLNHYVADMYEQDRFYQTLPASLDARWRTRMEPAV